MYHTILKYSDVLPVARPSFEGDGSPLHSFVMGLFPQGNEGCPRQEFGVLYRPYPDRVLIQSILAPNLASIREQDLVCSRSICLDWLAPEEILYFEVEACPVYNERATGTLRGIRKPLPYAEYPAWIRKQLSVKGLFITELDIGLPIRRMASHGALPLQHTGACFSGLAKIQEIESILRLVQYGLGVGKAFGWGLIRLERREPWERKGTMASN